MQYIFWFLVGKQAAENNNDGVSLFEKLAPMTTADHIVLNVGFVLLLLFCLGCIVLHTIITIDKIRNGDSLIPAPPLPPVKPLPPTERISNEHSSKRKSPSGRDYRSEPIQY